MDVSKTITAFIRAGQNEVTITRPLTQYDYGQVLMFDGVTLPEAYEVVFSNSDMSDAVGKSQIGDSEGVTIPDEFLTNGQPVYAWLFLHETGTDGRTVYKIKIPVRKRAEDITNPPTEEEQTSVSQAIVALNAAVQKVEDTVTHYPIIDDDYWYVWDEDDQEYQNTGVKAKGEDGQDGEKGDKGDTGDTGQNGKDPFFIYGTITYNHSNYELTTVAITTSADDIRSNWTVANPPVALVLTRTESGHTDYLIFDCKVPDPTSNMITFERLVMDGNPIIYLESILLLISGNSVITEYDRQVYEKAHVTVDVVPDGARTYANGSNKFTVTHSKYNCDSYLVGVNVSGSANLSAKILSTYPNSADIEVTNTGDSVRTSLLNTIWLCVSAEDEGEIIPPGEIIEP